LRKPFQRRVRRRKDRLDFNDEFCVHSESLAISKDRSGLLTMLVQLLRNCSQAQSVASREMSDGQQM
jgi:hypothetical protein